MTTAPTWLRESFRDGVDERYAAGPFAVCWLAQHDRLRRRCSGPLERFHFIGRQRVRKALEALWPFDPLLPDRANRDPWVEVAEWDPRNGGIACEGHHRRFDSHLTPTLVVPRPALPAIVEEFSADWGLEQQIEDRFPLDVADSQPIR